MARIRAESFFPMDKEIFELVLRGQHEVTLQGPGGRYLIPDPRDGHTPRLAAAGHNRPAARHSSLCRPGTSRFALRPHGSNASLVFALAAEHPGEPQAARPVWPSAKRWKSIALASCRPSSRRPCRQ